MYKLKLNVSKTKHMCIGKQLLINEIGNIELTIEQQRIEKVCVMKYLGVMIKFEF